MSLSYTLWPSIYDIDSHVPVREEWPAFVARFSTHTAYPRKEAAPGFGPYRLGPPPNPCHKHPGAARLEAHRCTACVRELHLAVFDVDVGTVGEVERCSSYLRQSNLAHLWFTTWSYKPDADRPSLRLVIPFAVPVPEYAWDTVRTRLFRALAIPADPNKCSGTSHFYYAPACPTERLGDAWVDVELGDPYDATALLRTVPKRRPPVFTVAPPAEGSAGTNDVRTAVERAVRRWSGAHVGPDKKEKARVLQAALAGAALADHGSRNETTWRIAGTIASLVPEASTEALVAFLAPSLVKMVEAGSSLTADDLERFCATGLAKARERKERDLALGRAFGKRR